MLAVAVAVAVAAIGFVVLVALLYVAATHANAGDSDGATVALEGHAMSQGHLLLKGWALSLDSFWTIDALFYAVVEIVTGMRSVVLYFVPAIIAALVVVVGIFLAREGRRGRPAWAASLTAVALLGLPTHTLSMFILRGPLHVGTVLWCLIAFGALRSGRFGWGWIVAVVFLCAGLLGDSLTIALGIVPVLGAAVVAMLRARDWRAGVPEAGAAGAAVVLAACLRSLSDLAGSFTTDPKHPIATLGEAVANVPRIATWSASLLGVGNDGLGNGGVPSALQAVHVVGLAVVVLAVVTALAALVRGAARGCPAATGPGATWRLDDLLVMAVITDLVVFVTLTTSSDDGYLRYLTGAVVFGSVLAARAIGRFVEATSSPRLLRTSAVSGIAVLAAFTTGFGLTLSAPPAVRPFSQLDRFLESHRLTKGVGDYWSASVTTVATDGAVTVRPVVATPAGRVERYQRQSSATWYGGSFQFLVYDTALPWGGVDLRSASATFGSVAEAYDVGTYRVLVWEHPITVSNRGYANDADDTG